VQDLIIHQRGLHWEYEEKDRDGLKTGTERNNETERGWTNIHAQ